MIENEYSKYSICFFFLVSYTARATIRSCTFFMEKIIQVVRKMNLSVKEY